MKPKHVLIMLGLVTLSLIAVTLPVTSQELPEPRQGRIAFVSDRFAPFRSEIYSKVFEQLPDTQTCPLITDLA